MAATLIAAQTAGAQAVDTLPPPLAGPGTIVGIVVDAADRPIESAEVRLDVGRRTLSGPDGTFRFDSLARGDYAIAVRKLSYRPETRWVTLGGGPNGSSVRIKLIRAATLPPVVTIAVRRGLSGTVSDTALTALRGVTLDVLGAGAKTTTDSAGRFYIDLKPGQHMVRVKQDGYRTQMVSVSIPRDSGRSVAIWMTAASSGSTARESVAAFDLDRRLVRRNPVWSHLLTREDLAKYGSMELGVAVGLPIRSGACFVYLDGGPQKQVLWTLDTDDVEFLEVYEQKRRRSTRMARVAPDGDMPTPGCGTLTLIAWLRK